jgi:predicted transposase YdaD
MPRRIRAYAALAEERYHLPVYPVLITILPPSANTIIPTQYSSTFMGLHAQQDYQVINLWEVDAQIAFQPELNALLPFVPIMEGGGEQAIVQQAVQSLRMNETLTDFEPLLAFFATFVLDSSLVQEVMRWDMVVLRESPWYNEILSKGIQEGRQEGRQEEAASILLRLLNRRFGRLPDDLIAEVSLFSVEQLELLGDSLFDFTTIADLQIWLSNLS